jgi:hypothetical protein
MKLTYAWKKLFNINRTTIHFALAILLNKNFNKLKSFIDPKNDNLIINYDKFHLLVINDFFFSEKKCYCSLIACYT